MNGRFTSPGATGGGGVLPVWGDVAGASGRHRRFGGWPAAGGATVAQSMVAPSDPCVVPLMKGFVLKMEFGRPPDGLTTHWIQLEAFSAWAHDPWMYQLALSPRSMSKRVN